MAEVEDVLKKMQNHNQQLQAVMLQKQTFMIQGREIENALSEMEKSGDDVYKSVGPLLVKSSKTEIRKELEETKEEIDLRLKTLERQENSLKEKVKDGQEKLQNLVSNKPTVGQGG